MIHYVYVRHCLKHGVDPASPDSLRLVRHLQADCSQSISRQVAGCEHLPAITSSSVVYSYHHDRVLTPAELLRAYGFPGIQTIMSRTGHGRLTADSLKDLASECMALPCLGVVIVAMMCALGQRLPGLWSHRT